MTVMQRTSPWPRTWGVASLALLAGLGLVWFGGPAHAQEGADGLGEAEAAQLDSALHAAANVPSGNHPAYLAARDAVLEFGPAAIPQLDARAAAEQWTRENWRVACVAAVCRNHLAGEEFVEYVERPSGLDREQYMMFRKPVPMPARDFIRAGKPGVPHLMERFVWTFEEYPYSQENGEEERHALMEALLYVPGRVEDRRAVAFLTEVATDPNREAHWRGAAARSLGQAGSREAAETLLELLQDEQLEYAARHGVLRGLGHTYTEAALDALLRELSASLEATESEEAQQERYGLRLACIQALGTLGNWLAWHRRFPDEAEREANLRERAAMPLVRLLATDGRTDYERQEITVALSAIAFEGSVEALQRLAARDGLEEDVRNALERAARVVPRMVERRAQRLARDNADE